MGSFNLYNPLLSLPYGRGCLFIFPYYSQWLGAHFLRDLGLVVSLAVTDHAQTSGEKVPGPTLKNLVALSGGRSCPMGCVGRLPVIDQ